MFTIICVLTHNPLNHVGPDRDLIQHKFEPQGLCHYFENTSIKTF